MRACFFATLLLLLALFVQVQNQPEVKVNYFQNLPVRLYFFDDATVRGHISNNGGICQHHPPPPRTLHTMTSYRATSTCPPTRAKFGNVQRTYPKGTRPCS